MVCAIVACWLTRCQLALWSGSNNSNAVQSVDAARMSLAIIIRILGTGIDGSFLFYGWDGDAENMPAIIA